MSSTGRASLLLGAGTLVSRATGLLRTIVLAAALGAVSAPAANAFAIANQLPNNIYAIISTGLLTGVLLPQIVKAASHADGGSAFVSKLLTLGVVVLMGATVVAVVAAPLLVQIYGGRLDPAAQALTLAFAYWCLPQLLFYGLYAILGEVLNARRVFGPATWSPIINNVISIAGFGVFIALFGTYTSAFDWTPDMVTLIGATATGGIVAQALVLLFFWRRTRLTLRVDFRWRGIGLRGIGRLAWWTFLMVVVGQIAGAVQSNLVGAASDTGAAQAALALSWTVFILPYSVIAYSIGTPYFTRLSEHAAAGRHDAVRSDLDTSTRAILVFMVAALAAVGAAVVPISRILAQTPEDAAQLAWVLGAFLVGLIPLSVLFVVQRTFYAYHDTFQPFLFTLVQAVLVIATAIAASATLPLEFLAAGIALGQSLAGIVQLAVAFWMLRRKLGLLGLARAGRACVRFLVAAVPAAAAGWGVYLWSGGLGGWMISDRLLAVVGTILVGAVSLAVYVLGLVILGAPELEVARGAIRRLRRR